MIALASSFAERFSTPSTCIWLVRFPEEHCAPHSRVFLFHMFNFRIPFFHGLQRLCKTCNVLPLCKYANYARLTLQNQCSYGKKLDFRNQHNILPPSGLSFRCPALQPRRVGFFVDIPRSTKQRVLRKAVWEKLMTTLLSEMNVRRSVLFPLLCGSKWQTNYDKIGT